MSGEMVLRASEAGAVSGKPFEVHVTGKRKKSKKGKFASWGATGFAVLMVVFLAIFFSVGNLMPAAIGQRLLEETDVQYADLVESKKIILQQALRDGEIPDDTAAILKEKGYRVGYLENGEFKEANKADRELAIEHDGKVITADEFITAMGTDAKLYAAVKEATYDRAAAYYDEAAEQVFEDLGTTRNNFTSDEEFAEVMQRVMGSGNAVDINSAEMAEKTETDEEGNTTTTREPATTGAAARAGGDTAAFIEEVRLKNPAATADESAVKAADALKVADTVAQEQRSSLAYALFMENISKMKAGDGNESKIHDTMNFLTTGAESKVVDTKTGEVISVFGSPLESPSMYALLAGTKADKGRVGNYSSDRILKTVRNKAAGAAGYSPIKGTVASVEDEVKGSIGTWVDNRSATAAAEVMQSVEPTVKASLVENGYENMSGVGAGEIIAQGAVNLSRRLAQTSGATAGDDAAVAKYARVTQSVIAMEAEAERMTKSPLDITSKNTFLGSIVHKIAMVQATQPEVRNLGSLVRNFSSVVGSSMKALLPMSSAEDAGDGYMTDYGECETLSGIGAVATAGCAEIAVFDTSTLNDPLHNDGFISYVEANTEVDAVGNRKVLPGSNLANFISFSVGRLTPVGIMDGGILEALKGGGEKIPFLSDILALIQQLLGASEEEKRMASGEAFANTRNNGDWQQYKYAQRYVALARATAMLKEHSSDSTAYAKLKYFEGDGNPVMAFLREERALARR